MSHWRGLSWRREASTFNAPSIMWAADLPETDTAAVGAIILPAKNTTEAAQRRCN